MVVMAAAVAFPPPSAIAASSRCPQRLQIGYRSISNRVVDGGDASFLSHCRSVICKSERTASKLWTQLRINQLQHVPRWSRRWRGDSIILVRFAGCSDQGFERGRAVAAPGGHFSSNSGSGPKVLTRCSSSSPTALTEEDSPETIDPGLLARVSKLYRPAVILPGLGNNSADYNALTQSLETLQIPTTVVKVARIDWLRNAAGLLDINYWKGTLQPRPVLNWYLDKVKAAIETAKQSANGDGKVSLIGHSAGGWLARVYLKEFGTEDVALLVTLGTPHMPPPRGVRGVFDQTRGLLNHLESNYPGAHHAPDVKYVCVAGRYMRGGGLLAEDLNTPVVATGAGTLGLENVASAEDETKESLAQTLASSQENNEAEKIVDAAVVTAATAETPNTKRSTFRERFVGAGYKQVCGKADVWGDGVVPEESALLEGALNISVEGVYHSPVGASDKDRPWYGSAGVIDQWVKHLLE